MIMMEWIGQVVAMIILIAGAFLMGVSINDRKQGKR